MHVSSSIVAGSPNNMNQPLELQLGLLGPANSAHPRSQSNRICTLPGLYTYIYIFIFIYLFTPYTLQPPRRQEFQPASQLSPIVTTTFTIVVLSNHVWKKKFPGTPCTCFVANASSSDFPHCGESTDTSCNLQPKISYLQSGWIRNFGSDSLNFPAFGFATIPKASTTNRFKLHLCLHPSWTCSPKPPQLVFRPWPINQFITQTHHTVNEMNHFTLWSRTIYACQLFDTGRLTKKNEPASGVAAGASGACKFCTSKVTIKSHLYPPRIVYIYIFIHPTHFSHLGGRSFSRRLSFHLSSQQLSLLSFSLIMFEKKFPGAPCTCCVANASSIFHTAVKVQIPLAIKNICNLAEVGTLGPIVFVFQLSVLLQAPKHLRQTGSNCIPVFILLEHALASLLCWCFGLHLSIVWFFTQTHSLHSKRKEPFHAMVKNNLCMSVLR